ncbi:MAG TPA: 2Fe-2S iron-sulfur cluster binding domain-containing protein, partial [Phycisphaerae bacterium]|nr:2Fe-2S iron-sulfur cluster binding domain-containing protein [Phycisphaerae bacterium]
MPKQQVRVTFQPSGRTIVVLPHTTALEVAAQAGLTIQTPCGGSGTCGKCRVQFTSGACEPTASDGEQLSDDEIAAGWRLACQTSICEDCVIHVPESSLFASQHQILTETTGEKGE